MLGTLWPGQYHAQQKGSILASQEGLAQAALPAQQLWQDQGRHAWQLVSPNPEMTERNEGAHI